MTNSFWTGGPEAYTKALRIGYQKQLQALEGRVNPGLNPAEKAHLNAEIARLKAEHTRRLADVSASLF